MTTDTIYGPLTFSCGHTKYDPEIHDGAWGARLIYNEVERGSAGVVYNRQGGSGDRDKIESELFPVYDEEAMPAIIEVVQGHVRGWRGQGERGHVLFRSGLVVVVASPQQSYGYLYVTALLEKPEAFGRTEVWSQDEMNSGSAEFATVISNVEPYRSQFRKHYEEELEFAQRDVDHNTWRSKDMLTALKDAEVGIEIFDKTWPAQPVNGPREPVAVIEFSAFTGRQGYDKPAWLEGIHKAKATCDEAGLKPAFQGGGLDDDSLKIVHETPGILWDGRVAFAEGYTHDGEMIVRNFLHGDTTATWEVYDARYVEALTEAAR